MDFIKKPRYFSKVHSQYENLDSFLYHLLEQEGFSACTEEASPFLLATTLDKFCREVIKVVVAREIQP